MVLNYCCAIVAYIADCVILSIQAGQLIADPLALGKCFASIIISFVLMLAGVKNSVFYLEESAKKQSEADEMSLQAKQESKRAQDMVAKQSKTLATLADVSGQISNASLSLAAESDSLASGATQQAASVEEVTSAIKDFSVKMRKTVELTQLIDEKSTHMNGQAAEGTQYMTELLESMNNIQHSVANIETINKTINDIAFQTNILALNAAVEAARAGVAGKGFAVVADEVRTLAGNSAQAAKETTNVLAKCRDSVEQGVAVTEKTAETLTKIKDSIETVAEQVAGILDTNEEQMSAVNMIESEAAQISNVVQTTAATAEQVAASVREITEQMEVLKRLGKE